MEQLDDNNGETGIDKSLLAQANAIDGAAAPGAEAGHGPATPGDAAPADWPNESRQLVAFLCTSIVPLWPSLGKVYTPETQTSIAAALAPVLQKYNFDLGRLFGRFGPEIGFAMVALPLVIPTLEAIKHDRKTQAKKGADAPTPPPPAAAGAVEGAAGIPDVNNLAARA